MIDINDLNEVKTRDFLEIKSQYRKWDSIKTECLFGNRVGDALLTIIIPVYDHPFELMKRAVNSVLYQRCDYSYQILIIDDFAGRKEESNFEKYIRELDDNRIIYYKNEKNIGVFGNWNRGIELAKSKWVTILHTDDFYKSNYLQAMKSIVDKHPEIDQLACKYKLVNLADKTLNFNEEYQSNSGTAKVYKVSYLDYLYEMYTSVKGAWFKRDALIEIGGFRSQGDGLGLDDYPLMLKIRILL